MVERIFFFVTLIFFTSCQTTKDLPKFDFQFFIEQKSKGDDFVWSSTATMPVSHLSIHICSQPILLAGDIESVRITQSNFGKCLIFQLTQRAAIEFYKLSVEGLNRKIVFVFNGKAIGLSMPIRDAKPDGTFVIFPEMEDHELDQLVKDIDDTIVKLRKLREN
ncbi:MAG: hypothetical protein LBH08_00845 [Puniceicoccales bacterium]|jgi:hypothetical protein|nr:hypothetical protein [Puniceicoccales bacterium]